MAHGAKLATALALLLSAALHACSDANGSGTGGVPRVLFSSDVANGLFDTHGASGQCAVSFSADDEPFPDSAFVAQDVDDGWALAMALNLDALDVVEVAGVFPTFGNATMSAEMLVARKIVRDLKGRDDIPIAPGAMAPATQTIRPRTFWFDGDEVRVFGAGGLFEASCRNPAVIEMEKLLLESDRPTTILATGPLTDVACLLNTSPGVAPRIAEIVALVSRIESESLQVNGTVVNDFNFRMDPGAGTLLLAAPGAREVPIRLMAFALTGQTSQADDLIVLDATSLRGPSPPTPESERSLAWMLRAQEARQDLWTEIFGTPEGPFDQYTLAAVLWPDLFDCQDGVAYVVECPFPAWSPAYPVDAQGDPLEDPYAAPDNPCIDHGPTNGSALSSVPAQLVVSLDPSESGPLVRGRRNVTGNLPARAQPARSVTVCTDFASAAARDEFAELLYEHSW